MYATFVGTNGREYTLTGEDVMWLTVALYGETHGSHSNTEWYTMMYTWLNRFMLHGPQAWGSLKYLIKNHSQPVNPKWREDGVFCMPGGSAHNKNACEADRLAWRAKMAYMLDTGELSEIPDAMVLCVELFATGQIDPLVDYTPIDFANIPSINQYGTKITNDGNTYFDKEQASATGSLLSNFDEGYVEPSNKVSSKPTSDDYTSTTVSKLGVVGVALVFGWLAYRIWKGR